MWNSTVFSNANGGAGGGFITSPNAFGSSQTPQSEKRRSERRQNLVPCTSAMIHRLGENDEHLMVGSMPVVSITVVGLIKSVDRQSTRITFTLDDRTGPPLDIQMWFGEDEENDGIGRLIVEGTYVRVIGSLRSVRDKKVMIAFKIIPLTDMNELTSHLVEILHTRMSIALMDKNSTASSDGNEGVPMAVDGPGGVQQAFGDALDLMGMKPNQKLVLQVIRTVKDDIGISLDGLCNHIKSLNRQTIKNVVDFLSSEGHIYTTIDDEHFKVTDG